MKTLYLHIGGAKTGSTAIQNFLHFNKSQLESIGFSYNHSRSLSHDREINSGNGESLFWKLLRNDSDIYIDTLLLDYFGENNKAVCSSELLATLNTTHWLRLINSAKRLNVNLKVIFYVRNAVSFFISSYNQFVKRGEYRSIETWIKNQSWQHLDVLKILYTFKNDIHYQILSYDQNSKSLIKSFIVALGIDHIINISNNEELKIVNRSLTNAEINTLQVINKTFGTLFSQELSDFFIYERPYAKSLVTFESVSNFIHTHFVHEVNWINQTFFANEQIMFVYSELVPEKKHEDDNEDKSITLELLSRWIVNKLKNLQTTNMEMIVSELVSQFNAIDWKNANHPDIPKEFDPIAYLLLNIDVFQSSARPYQHFINSGKDEKRKISWPKCNYLRPKPNLLSRVKLFFSRIFNYWISYVCRK